MSSVRNLVQGGKRALKLGVALVAVGGCAVGPDYVRPEEPALPAWRQQDPAVDATAANSLWWKEFQDPVLEKLIDTAYQQNLPLQVAGLRIVEARAQLAIATGSQWPQQQQLNASVAATGVAAPNPQTPTFSRNFILSGVGMDAVWEMDFWGKYRRGIESEANRLLASVGDYDAALVSLTAEVARTYVVIRTTQVLIDQARTNERLQTEGLAIAQSRFKNGATSELDVAQATTLLEGTRASIPPLIATLEQSKNALSTLLGQPVGNVDQLLAGQTGIPKPPEKVSVSVPAEMLRRRPDVRSAELNAAAQCARIGMAKADLYPSFSLFGSIGFEAALTGPAKVDLFSSQSLVYAVGPRINWPFLNYGRLENAVRVQDARFQAQLVNYRNTVLRAVQEVEDALVALIQARQAVVFEQRAVTSAQRAAELAVVQYREGSTDYQRVLDAERSLLQRQQSLTQASASVAANLIGLYKALGGGWQLRADQSFVNASTQEQMEKRTGWGGLLTEPRSQEKQQNPMQEKP